MMYTEVCELSEIINLVAMECTLGILITIAVLQEFLVVVQQVVVFTLQEVVLMLLNIITHLRFGTQGTMEVAVD